MNNAAFFVAGNNNYLTGADTVLGVDGLTKSEVAFLNQVDPDGKPIGFMPQVILVPPASVAQPALLPERDGHGRVGVRRPRFCLCVAPVCVRAARTGRRRQGGRVG